MLARLGFALLFCCSYRYRTRLGFAVRTGIETSKSSIQNYFLYSVVEVELILTTFLLLQVEILRPTFTI